MRLAPSSQRVLEPLHESAQTDTQHLADVPQLYQIKPTQTAFYVANERLWALECFGECLLGQP